MPSGDATAAESPWQQALVAAFAQQEMTQVDSWPLVPTAGTRGRLRAGGSPQLRVDVPLAGREDAASLLEQDGLHTWHFSAVETPVVPGPPPGRRARFVLSLTAGEAVGGLTAPP